MHIVVSPVSLWSSVGQSSSLIVHANWTSHIILAKSSIQYLFIPIGSPTMYFSSSWPYFRIIGSDLPFRSLLLVVWKPLLSMHTISLLAFTPSQCLVFFWLCVKFPWFCFLNLYLFSICTFFASEFCFCLLSYMPGFVFIIAQILLCRRRRRRFMKELPRKKDFRVSRIFWTIEDHGCSMR